MSSRPHRSLLSLLATTLGLVLLAGACGSDDQSVVTAQDSDPTPVPAPVATSAPIVTGEGDDQPATDEPQPDPDPEPVDGTERADESAPAPTAVPDRAATEPVRPSVLAVGSEGAAVEDTQDLLNDFIGYADLAIDRIAEDGVYGSGTEAAQRTFETYTGLAADGVADERDRAALAALVDELEADRAESVVAAGDQSSFVSSWQTRLNSWNELALERPTSIIVDGRFGPDTEAATRAVEEALGLQVDGIVEPQDRIALRDEITRLRSEQDATVLRRALVDDRPVVVRALFTNGRFCLRFVVGFAADERCTPTPGGDLNTAYFVTVNGVSFVGGTTNPNVAFAQIDVRNEGTVPVATRQIGDSLARAWVELVDEEPDSVEFLEPDGTSVLDMRFSAAPTDRDFFGATVAVLSPEYSQTFFVDECVRSQNSLRIEASLSGSRLVIDAANGTGSLTIFAGTDLAPVEITGTITAADIDDDAVVVTGDFTGDVFGDAAFTASTSC